MKDLRTTIKLHLPDGVCAAIRAGVREHPEATIDAFLEIGRELGFNASTIRIQFNRARITRATTSPLKQKIVAKRGDSEHRQAAAREIERCRQIARDKWGVEVTPQVIWKKRGRTAGTAIGTHTIDLNEGMAIAESEAFLQTVAHEFAHCTVNAMSLGQNRVRWPGERRSGKWAPHGEMWQSVMFSFGREPRRCHNYASAQELTVGGSRRTFEAHCACRVHQVSAVLVRRIEQGRRYTCRKCHQVIAIKR